MTASTDPGADPAATEPRGIAAEALRLFSSLTRHFQALAGLAGLEAREAAGVYVRAAIALAVALLFAAFGYVFLLLAIAFALDHFLHVHWGWIALGFAAVHLIGAAIAAAVAKRYFTTPIFRGTAEEIRRDTAALRRADSGNSVPLM